MSHNPWAGLASYQDPASGSTLLFCGRDNESYDLAALVDDNIFCTLYGKSGTGKTSLLNAGMFPRLRAMGYLPLSIRLGMEALGSTFQQCIAARLGKAATLQTADTVPLPADDQDEQWLWAWFARTRFVDSEGKVRFPVLVFDQFEEVFRSRRAEAETLLRQVHFMMDPSHSLGDDYDYNFRFLASIREDDLYLLEDSLDRHFMGDMKQCRYRLNALTDEGARDVILKPGEGLFATGEQDAIVDTVIGIARSADGSINTNILSLVCSRIYDHYQRSGDASISLDLVRRFVSSNPFEQFYNGVTENLGEKEKQFIEDRLVDAAGRRGSVSEPDFEKNVPNGAHLLEGTGRILQRVASGTEGRSYRIELIHDSFCAPLADQKLKRAARRRRRVIAALSAVALVVAAVAAYIVVASIRNARQTREILIQQEKFYAKQASQLLDEGDTYTALLLLNELTDPDGPFAKIPLQPEAERQMRRAIQMYEDAEWQVECTFMTNAELAGKSLLSPHGNYFMVSTIGGIDIYDNNTGLLLKRIKTSSINRSFPAFTMSHNGKLVAYQNYDPINKDIYIHVFDLESDTVLSISLKDSLYQLFEPDIQMVFSEDDKTIVAGVGSGAILDNNLERSIKAFDIDNGTVKWTAHELRYDQISNIESGNLEGRRIALANFENPNVLILDVKTGEIIHTVKLTEFIGYKYLNDDELLVLFRNGGISKYTIHDRKWTELVNRKFDMRGMNDIGTSKHQFMVSNQDTLFLYNSKDGNLECIYLWDPNTYWDPTLCADSTLLLVNIKTGWLHRVKYKHKDIPPIINKPENDYHFQKEQTEDGRYYFTIKNIRGDVSVFSCYDNNSREVLFSDTVNNTARIIHSISPTGEMVIVEKQDCYLAEDGVYRYDHASYLLFDIKKKQWTALDTPNGWALSFSPNGKSVFCLCNYGTVLKKYDIESRTYKTCGHFNNEEKSLRGFHVSRNNDNILLESFNQEELWTLDSKKYSVVKILEGGIFDARYTPDGKTLVVVNSQGALVLLDSKYKEIGCVYAHVELIDCISPDSRHLVTETMDGRLELWALPQLRKLATINHPYYYPSCPISFSSDGKNLVFYSDAETKEGVVGVIHIPILTQEELKERVRELAGGRKLTEEGKGLLME